MAAPPQPAARLQHDHLLLLLLPPPVPGTDLGLSRAAQEGPRGTGRGAGGRTGPRRAGHTRHSQTPDSRRLTPVRGRRDFIKGPAASGAPPIGCRGGQGGHVTRRLWGARGGDGERRGLCGRAHAHAQGREGAKAAAAPPPGGSVRGGEAAPEPLLGENGAGEPPQSRPRAFAGGKRVGRAAPEPLPGGNGTGELPQSAFARGKWGRGRSPDMSVTCLLTGAENVTHVLHSHVSLSARDG